MNTERIKSFVLFSLVIMSFVLTTRLWFNVSIEGLFVSSPKDKLTETFKTTYEKESLLKPDKVVVHIGQNDALLFNNQSGQGYYNSILKSSNDILKDLLDNKENNYTETAIGMDQLQNIREGRAVELIYNSSTELEYIKSLLDVQKNLWNDIKQVTSIIICPEERQVYIIDQNKSVIHQFNAAKMPDSLENAIDEIKASQDIAVFLSNFNEENRELYGKYAIAPVSIASMPELAVKKEIEPDEKLNKDIASFFNDADSSNISSNLEPDGAVTFTDREEETVKIGNNGVLEYYKYNVTPGDIRNTDIKEAVSIAADYVNKHFGFNGDFYLSNIESVPQGGRTSYVVSFGYRYNGIPIVTDETDLSKSAIEVEIVGQEVIRYKRNVKAVESEVKNVKIKTFEEILDIVQGALDERLSTTKAENIAKINDLSLVYIEWDGTLTPYWVADIDVQSNVSDIKTTNNKKYFIRAEDGFIMVEQ